MRHRQTWKTGLLVSLVAAALATSAAAEGEQPVVGDPELPWLDNAYYKVLLDIRARLSLANIDGFSGSQAYTVRTRAALQTKPLHGFSTLAELENTWSIATAQYFDGAHSRNSGKSLIADPENIELNRAWVQYAEKALFGSEFGVKAKAGRQRIILDDARFIGNVGWRQNEQTYDAALGETDLGVDDLTAQYAYLWEIRRIFGRRSSDYGSQSHLARLNYVGLDWIDLTAFAYFLDFRNDSPSNSSNSYGLRGAGRAKLDDDLSLGYSASYAFQTDAGSNPVDYDTHYVWAELDLKLEEIGTVAAGYEMLGSDDGKSQFVTPLATAHKFNGFADAFLNNGGPRGLQDLFFTVAPAMPWKLQGKLVYHEFFRADGGGHLGRELDGVISRAINSHLTALAKGAWFDGTRRGPADRWRVTFELTFKY
jgi:hypothetical protein